MLSEKIQKIIENWKAQDLDLVTPYSEKEIKESFNKIGKLVSKDIIQVYSVIGGIADEWMDNKLLSFWTLKGLVKENLHWKFDKILYQPNFTLFGDFLISSHFYAFNYENENTSSVYSDFETGEFLKIADSIEEFLSLYLTSPTEIGLYQE